MPGSRNDSCVQSTTQKLLVQVLLLSAGGNAKIDRRGVVKRHTPTVQCESWRTCNPLDFATVGNGKLAFSVDVTGLQTFNTTLQDGGLCNPLNTLSEWGWHTTPVAKSQFQGASPETFAWQAVPAYNHSAEYPTGCLSQ